MKQFNDDQCYQKIYSIYGIFVNYFLLRLHIVFHQDSFFMVLSSLVSRRI